MIRSLSLALALASVSLAARVAAQDVTCDSCASCTEKLAAEGAHVALSADLDGDDACIVLAGRGAWLNGAGHTVHGGVRIDGEDGFVRQLSIRAERTALTVRGASATVMSVELESRDVGLAVSASQARIVRSSVRARRIGIALGAATTGACPAGAVAHAWGAVLRGVRVEGAEVGITACESRPVITGSTVTGNGIGLLLGAPAVEPGVPASGAPSDDCLTAPSLEEVRPTSTIFFSSGCGGCLVHEGWLPDLRARGVELVARTSGMEHAEAQARFDAYAARCTPEVIDALGIPGCVPNYGCPASGRVAKRRERGDALAIDAPLQSPGDVARFAAECAAAGSEVYGRGPRVLHALAHNDVCGNRTADVRASGPQLPGLDDACGKAEGFADEGAPTGCARACGTPPSAPVIVLPPPAPTPRAAPEAAPPPSAPEPSEARSDPPAELPRVVRDRSDGGSRMALVVVAILALAVVVWLFARPKRSG